MEALLFIGHFGLAFGAKRIARPASLGALFVACQFADLLWPTLVLLGYERVSIQPGATAFTPLDFVSYPYSHSLLALSGWALVLGLVYVVVARARLPVALTLALLVVSHWLLDYLTHRRDMPLTLHGSERLGLGLWNSIPATLTVEGAIFAIGVAMYARATVARDRVGSIGLWALIGFLLVVYMAAAFGPPPPDAAAVAWSAEAMWLIVVWGFWIDNHRVPRN